MVKDLGLNYSAQLKDFQHTATFEQLFTNAGKVAEFVAEKISINGNELSKLVLKKSWVKCGNVLGCNRKYCRKTSNQNNDQGFVSKEFQEFTFG